MTGRGFAMMHKKCSGNIFKGAQLTLLSACMLVFLPSISEANEELMADISAPLFEAELIDDFNNKCEQFVTDAGYVVGQNLKKQQSYCPCEFQQS